MRQRKDFTQVPSDWISFKLSAEEGEAVTMSDKCQILPSLILMTLLTIGVFKTAECRVIESLGSSLTDEVFEEEMIRLSKDTLHELSIAKFWLVSGNPTMAINKLYQIKELKGELKFIRDRYLAIAYFTKDEFKKSYEILKDPYFHKINEATRQVCLLQIVNKIALGINNHLNEDLKICLAKTSDNIKDYTFWSEFFVALSLRSEKAMEGDTILATIHPGVETPLIRLWLKMKLYTNHEKQMTDVLQGLPESVFSDPSQRELIGLAFFRQNEVEKAFEFVEDINTANAENIKGSYRLKREEYELALGHFKLALKLKNNSFNAIERLLPLTWILSSWDDAQEATNHYFNEQIDHRKKLAYEATIKLRNNEDQEVKGILNYLEILFPSVQPKLFHLIKAENALHLKDERNLTMAIENACQENDGMFCWLKTQSTFIKKIGVTLESEEEIAPYARSEIEKLKMPMEKRPIQEAAVLSQKEIEELDFGQFEVSPIEFNKSSED